MSKYERESDDVDVICPYCGHRYQFEIEGFNEDERTEVCYKCGKKYWLSNEVVVENHTHPDCGLNGDEHQFVKIIATGGRPCFHCNVCGANKI
jgi:hypothetical protein